MLQIEKVARALAAVEECCGHCAICSPDCPVAIAKRALTGLRYDLESYAENEQAEKCYTRERKTVPVPTYSPRYIQSA